MRGGKLRRRVNIEQQTLVQDGTGNPVPTWNAFAANVPAEIVEASGREILQAGQVNPQRRLIVSLRYMTGITPSMRIVYGTRTFYIDSPPLNVNERNRELKITCLEHA